MKLHILFFVTIEFFDNANAFWSCKDLEWKHQPGGRMNIQKSELSGFGQCSRVFSRTHNVSQTFSCKELRIDQSSHCDTNYVKLMYFDAEDNGDYITKFTACLKNLQNITLHFATNRDFIFMVTSTEKLNLSCNFISRYYPPESEEIKSCSCGGSNYKEGTITNTWTAAILSAYNHNFDNVHFRCTGALFSVKHVLTVAECLIAADTFSTFVLLGASELSSVKVNQSNKLNSRGILIKAQSIIIHPNYDWISNTPENNIAIIELEQYVTISEAIEPACLPFSLHNLPYLYKIYIGGWNIKGMPYIKINDVSLKQSVMNIYDHCSHYFPYMLFNRTLYDEYTICSYGIKTCKGTRGEPMVINKNKKATLLGISVYNELEEHCESAILAPRIFLDVRKHMKNFIFNIVDDNLLRCYITHAFNLRS